MKQEHKKILDDWWITEPFGWDHPDTYNGISEVVEKCVEKLEAELAAARAEIIKLKDLIDAEIDELLAEKGE